MVVVGDLTHAFTSAHQRPLAVRYLSESGLDAAMGDNLARLVWLGEYEHRLELLEQGNIRRWNEWGGTGDPERRQRQEQKLTSGELEPVSKTLRALGDAQLRQTSAREFADLSVAQFRAMLAICECIADAGVVRVDATELYPEHLSVSARELYRKANVDPRQNPDILPSLGKRAEGAERAALKRSRRPVKRGRKTAKPRAD